MSLCAIVQCLAGWKSVSAHACWYFFNTSWMCRLVESAELLPEGREVSSSMVMYYSLFSERRRYGSDVCGGKRLAWDCIVYSRQICSLGNTPRTTCEFKNLLDSELLFLVESLPISTKTDCIRIMIFQKYSPWVIKHHAMKRVCGIELFGLY